MLPANLAKGRAAAAAARGLGEFLMVAGAGGAGGQPAVLPALRYSPYTLPSLELSPGSSGGSDNTTNVTTTPTLTHSQHNNYHQAIVQAANLQQIQMLGVDFSSTVNTSVANTLFGSIGCKPRNLASYPSVTSPHNGFGYNMAAETLVSLPGYPGLEGSSYQVPVGL